MNPCTTPKVSTPRRLTFALLLVQFFAILATAATGTNTAITIVCLGDSLTEGYGVAKEKAYPALVETKLQALHLKDSKWPEVRVINAGISGSTTASALGRLKWYLKQKPNVVFLALGANDGLRGQDIDSAKANLRATILLAKQNQIEVWLGGMYMPPNYGAAYTKKFHKIFVDLAKEEHLAFLPFLLEGVALHPDLVQPDGIHPNEKGHQEVATRVFDFFKAHLKERRQ